MFKEKKIKLVYLIYYNFAVGSHYTFQLYFSMLWEALNSITVNKLTNLIFTECSDFKKVKLQSKCKPVDGLTTLMDKHKHVCSYKMQMYSEGGAQCKSTQWRYMTSTNSAITVLLTLHTAHRWYSLSDIHWASTDKDPQTEWPLDQKQNYRASFVKWSYTTLIPRS